MKYSGACIAPNMLLNPDDLNGVDLSVGMRSNPSAGMGLAAHAFQQTHGVYDIVVGSIGGGHVQVGAILDHSGGYGLNVVNSSLTAVRMNNFVAVNSSVVNTYFFRCGLLNAFFSNTKFTLRQSAICNSPPFHSTQRSTFFESCDLSMARFDNCEFENCVFIKCTFYKTQFIKCKFRSCSFLDCNLSLAEGFDARVATMENTRCRLANDLEVNQICRLLFLARCGNFTRSISLCKRYSRSKSY